MGRKNFLRELIEKDINNLIRFDNEDCQFIIDNVMLYLKDRFPNRIFNVIYKSRDYIGYFDIIETITHFDENLKSCEKRINFQYLYVEQVFLILDELGFNLKKDEYVEKYSYFLIDYRTEISGIVNSHYVKYKLLGIDNMVIEIREDRVARYRKNTSSWGGLDNYRSYDFKYHIVTYLEKEHVNKMLGEKVKKR